MQDKPTNHHSAISTNQPPQCHINQPTTSDHHHTIPNNQTPPHRLPTGSRGTPLGGRPTVPHTYLRLPSSSHHRLTCHQPETCCRIPLGYLWYHTADHSIAGRQPLARTLLSSHRPELYDDLARDACGLSLKWAYSSNPLARGSGPYLEV